MKAQAMGAIPITSRFSDSVLPAVSGRYDLGPIIGLKPSASADTFETWRLAWIQSIVAATKRQDLKQYRREMSKWARQEFSWEHSASLWTRVWQGEIP